MNSQILDLLKLHLIFTSSSNSLQIFILITLVEFYPKYLPYLTEYFFPKRILNDPPKQQIKSEIQFERQKEDKNSKQNNYFQNRMDAVIYTISKIPTITKLLSITHHDYLPYEYEYVKVDEDIYFQLLDIRFSDGNVELLKFRLFSYNHESIFLQSYVESCILNYDRHMSNKLGTNKYYFDMMVQQKTRSTMQNTLPSNFIMFTKHKFQTSRNFSNVYFDERDSLKAHTEFFLERKDWYHSKGIPHTLGFMFHGEPGCGKTSTIKAIANVGKRHIINIHLSEIKSKEQLNHLFFNDEINVWDNGKTERYTIPVNERMYVIEDIDAMGDIVLKRDFKKPEIHKKEIKMDEFGNIIQEPEQNPIDLSFLLNLLDGTLESEGRIIAITTNYPERIDKALIRPGRIDMIVHFKKCSLKTLCEMVGSFYDKEIVDTGLADLEGKWTPAEINQILFRNFKDSSNGLYELISLNPADLYGFEN
jgi:hypothetical protein